MRLTSRGQVTIPAALRAKYGLSEGDEVDVVEEDGVLSIVRARDTLTRGQRLVRHMRGRGTAPETEAPTADELIEPESTEDIERVEGANDIAAAREALARIDAGDDEPVTLAELRAELDL